MRLAQLIRVFALPLMVAGLLSLSAQSIAADRVLDSAAARLDNVELEWAQVDFRRGASDPNFHLMKARLLRVEYRLELAAWQNKRVRLYYVVPGDTGIQGPQGLTVSWTSQGAIRNGQARSGERTLVFEGLVTEARWPLVMDLELLVDSRYFTGRTRIEPYFEIETIG